MNRTGKIALWLAGGLALNAGARADTIVSADNPYTPVVARNIFGLNPVQATDAAPVDPPPKITLTGIMSISGKAQVLFKAAGTGKPGQPAKDQFYILSLGQRQDDIEVTRINEKAELVTFNNHGTVQEIPLASTPALTATPTPGPGREGRFPVRALAGLRWADQIQTWVARAAVLLHEIIPASHPANHRQGVPSRRSRRLRPLSIPSKSETPRNNLKAPAIRPGNSCRRRHWRHCPRESKSVSRRFLVSPKCGCAVKIISNCSSGRQSALI